MRPHRPNPARFVHCAAGIGIGIACRATFAFAQDPSSITLNTVDPCNKSPSATVNLNAPAPAGGVTVQLTSTVPANASVPASVVVRDGRSSAEFQITCVPSRTQSIAATLTASVSGRPTVATIVVNIPAPVLSQIILDPHTGSAQVKARAVLVSAAGPGGVVVTLSSTSTKAVVPAFVTVPERSTTGLFTIETKPVAQPTVVSILATGLGVSKTAELNIQPPHPVLVGFNNKSAPATILPTKSVEGSNSAQLRLNLGFNAPCCGGFPVQVTTSHPALVIAPPTVAVETGETFADFAVTTKSVSQSTSVTITVTSGGVSQSCVLTLTPPELKSFSLTPNKVIGGQNSQGKLFYFSPAPPGGIPVMLSSNNPNLVGVTKQLMVPAGATELLFPIETNGLEQPATVTISVDAAGQKKTTQLELVPEGPTGVRLVPNAVAGGTFTKGFVDAVQSTDAFTVKLTSSNPAVATVPASVSFTSGVTQREFQVQTTAVAQDTRVTISASTSNTTKSTGNFVGMKASNYSVTRTVEVEVLAPGIASFTLDNNFIVPPGTRTGTVTLTSKAPTGGMPVSITSTPFGNAGAGNAVVVPAGATSTTFMVTAIGVQTNTNVSLKASTGSGQTRTVSLQIRPQ